MQALVRFGMTPDVGQRVLEMRPKQVSLSFWQFVVPQSAWDMMGKALIDLVTLRQ